MTENTKESSVPLPSELQQSTINEPAVQEGNPLAQYFRHSKLQIELPTGGNFWPEGSIDLIEGKFLDVMPMTARDEIIMKSPEGLLSGTSLADTITSCIPGIKDPWAMPVHDIDTILIAIRLASYDHNMEFNSKCPVCDELQINNIDLRVLLDNIPKGKIKNVFKMNDLTYEFKPYTFRFFNENNKAKFEQEQLARTIASSAIVDDEKKSYFETVFKKLADHNTETLVVAIHKINTKDGTVVSDKNQIKDFIDNASRATIKEIRAKMNEMNLTAAIQPITIKCDKCKKEYEKVVEFNQSTFFE